MTEALKPIFEPKSVAVIGATEKSGSVGRTLFWNLLSSPFGGTVYPVNPKRASVLGVRAYPSLSDLPEHIDLAVSSIAEGTESLPSAGKRVFEELLDVASGKLTKAEVSGYCRAMNIYTVGPVI